MSYMSNGIQGTHGLLGMSIVQPVSGNVLCRTCSMVHKDTHGHPGMSTVQPVSRNVLCHTCPMVHKGTHVDVLGDD